jgi:transposase-like protein
MPSRVATIQGIAECVTRRWTYNTIRPHASIGYKPPAPEVFVPAFAATAMTCSLFLDRSLLENSSLAASAIRAAERGRTMKRSRFTEAQIAFILRQGEEGTAVGEICRKAGISEATYYNWRKKYGGLMPSEMKRLKLEEENGKLKKIVADLSLDKEMLQDVIRRKL